MPLSGCCWISPQFLDVVSTCQVLTRLFGRFELKRGFELSRFNIAQRADPLINDTLSRHTYNLMAWRSHCRVLLLKSHETVHVGERHVARLFLVKPHHVITILRRPPCSELGSIGVKQTCCLCLVQSYHTPGAGRTHPNCSSST